MKNDKQTYEVSVIEQRREASVAHAALIMEKGNRLKENADLMVDKAIESANLSREIGMECLAWMDREQMKFECFEKFFRDESSHLPEWFTSAAARKFIACYKKYPEPITELKTALKVMEDITFFSVGLLEDPRRTTVQKALNTAPLEIISNIWGKLDEELHRFQDEYPVAQWDRNTWVTVVDATRSAAELHQRGVQQLRRMPR